MEMFDKDSPDLKASSYFVEKWTSYLKLRGISNHDENKPAFPSKYDVKARDKFYASVSFSGWGGASGHDAPMIAYDAMLGGGYENWSLLVKRAMLHGGDSDSTGILAGSWYGALNGFKGVPEIHYKNVEYAKESMDLGRSLVQTFSSSSTSFALAEQHLQKMSRKNAPPMVMLESLSFFLSLSHTHTHTYIHTHTHFFVSTHLTHPLYIHTRKPTTITTTNTGTRTSRSTPRSCGVHRLG
jgi:hypothetical protein